MAMVTSPLVAQIMNSFQTGVAPVKPKETIEILAFMEAADESKRQGGTKVRVKDVLARADGKASKSRIYC
jgi:hypothetical protein